MKHTRTRLLLAGCALAALAAGLGGLASVHAQSGGGYDLTWNSIDGGAMASAGGGYSLEGTIGQPDAGVLSGGGYTLAGGFWGGLGGVVPRLPVYLPLVMR